jgi:hypothetical protein
MLLLGGGGLAVVAWRWLGGLVDSANWRNPRFLLERSTISLAITSK